MTGAQQLGHSIDRVAFGDTPEIELDAVDIEGDRPRVAVEDDVTRTVHAAATLASSGASGTRSSPRKKPQAFIRGPTVMSKAPSDSSL